MADSTPDDPFPFEYVGTGYFRQKGAPKGKPAPILHGMQAIEYVLSQLAEARRTRDAMRAALSYTLLFREFSEEWCDMNNESVVHFRELRAAALTPPPATEDRTP